MRAARLTIIFCLFASIATANDKLAGGIKAGSTSVSLPVELRKSADSTSLTGKVYTDVTASYWRQGGTRTAITMATLGSVNAAWSSGGFVEVDATNMPGIYRFDVPDAAFATGADWVVISLKVSGAFQQSFMFALESVGPAENYSRIGAAGAGLTALGDTRIANLDATVSSRMASFTLPTNFSSLSIDGSGRVDVGKVGGTAQTARDLGAQLDATVSSRSTYAGGDTSGTTTLLSRLTSGRATNLDNLDAAVSSRSTYAGADTAGTTTLLSRLTATRAGYLDNISVAPPTVAQMLDTSLTGHNIAGTWGAAVTSAGNAADPWAVLVPGSYGPGTAGNVFGGLKTINPSTVSVVSPVSVAGGTITVRAGDSWTIPINGLGNISGNTKLWFAVNKLGEPDAQSKLFIERTAGLTTVNGAAYGTSASGSLTVNDATLGNVTLVVDESVTKLLAGTTPWTIKMLDASGNTKTLAIGTFVVTKYGIEATQ